MLGRRDPGGALLRRLLPAALIAPLVLGVLVDQGERIGLYGGIVAQGILIATLALLLSALLWRAAWQVSELSAQREHDARALRQADEERVHLLESITDAFIAFDSNWRFVYVNAHASEILGRSPGELLGCSVWELFPQEVGTEFYQALQRARAAGVPQTVEAMSTITGRWYENRIYPTQHGVSSFIRDVTERKRSEGALSALARLYAVLSHVNEVIVRTRDGSQLLQETCRIVAEHGGFPLVWIGLLEEHEVRPVAGAGSAIAYLRHIRVEMDGELGTGPTGVCVRENRAAINDDFQSNAATCPWRARALAFGFRASAAFPLHRHGRLVGALSLYANRAGAFDREHVELLQALCADVSYALDSMDQERQRAEFERALSESERHLREVDQRKSDFLAVLSHELRNPLSPIKNSLYVLDRTAPGSEQAERAKGVINRQVGQLAHLVDDLLDLTRIARNKIELQRQAFDLNELVARTAEDHRSLLETKRLELELCRATGVVPVNADPNRVAQVVGNLLQNAVKFTDPGGRVIVRIDADLPERRAVISVADTGIGLDPELMKRLFEPFVQAETGLDRGQGGLGLGLALVKGLVGLHGGNVWARSGGIGQGSEFVIRLPLEQDETGLGRPEPREPERRSRRVLIIEDNADAADTLREVLELGGHDVAVAYDGAEGLRRAREFRPEFVLCDIGLPGMDGYEVARAFRSDEALRNARLVALTGYASSEDQHRAMEAGFNHHLAKPPSVETLEGLLTGVDGYLEQAQSGVWVLEDLPQSRSKMAPT